MERLSHEAPSGQSRWAWCRVMLLLHALAVIPGRCWTADCGDTVYSEARVCLSDSSVSPLSCPAGQFLLIQGANVVWTSSDQCPLPGESPGQCASTQDVADVIRDACDYLEQCTAPSNVGDDTEAQQNDCTGVKLLEIQYLCLEDSGPNDTGYVSVDTCEDRTWASHDIPHLSSPEGPQCPCSLALPAAHSAVYLHADVTGTCLGDVTVHQSGAVLTASGSHSRGKLYDLELCGSAAPGELTISIGNQASGCTIGLYVVVSDGSSPDLVCSASGGAGTENPNTDDEEDDEGLATEVLVGIVAGAVVIIILVIIVVVIICRRKGSETQSSTTGPETSGAAQDNGGMDIADDEGPAVTRTYPWSRVDEDDRVYQVNLDLSTASSAGHSSEDMVVVTDPKGLYAKPD